MGEVVGRGQRRVKKTRLQQLTKHYLRTWAFLKETTHYLLCRACKLFPHGENLRTLVNYANCSETFGCVVNFRMT